MLAMQAPPPQQALPALASSRNASNASTTATASTASTGLFSAELCSACAYSLHTSLLYEYTHYTHTSPHACMLAIHIWENGRVTPQDHHLIVWARRLCRTTGWSTCVGHPLQWGYRVGAETNILTQLMLALGRSWVARHGIRRDG